MSMDLVILQTLRDGDKKVRIEKEPSWFRATLIARVRERLFTKQKRRLQKFTIEDVAKEIGYAVDSIFLEVKEETIKLP